MNWSRPYGFKDYLKSSLWLVPFVAIPIELVVTRFLHLLDAWLGWTLTQTGARALLEAFVTITLSFVVFTFGSLLVAIQVASAQLTPRLIATTLLRDRVVKYTVALFIFSLMFALSAQNHMENTVHQLVMLLATLLGIFSLAAFFYLIDYASRLLRPISLLAHVGVAGIAVTESVYPKMDDGTEIEESKSIDLGAPGRVIRHRGASAIMVAADLQALRAQADRSKGIVEVVPQIGDFVAIDDPLFNLYSGACLLDEHELSSSVAFGSERVMDQDPTFAFRIVVDVGLKALSPAINDPTTAVLAMDQLHRLLRTVGRRHLRTDELLDRSGQVRVIFRTPNWDDFVYLAFSEIRSCGSNNLQVVRRMRAMIENLIQTLPQNRSEALLRQLSLLNREVERIFIYPEELALARVADAQGLGGHSGKVTH